MLCAAQNLVDKTKLNVIIVYMKKIQLTYSNGETLDFDLNDDPFEEIVSVLEDIQDAVEQRAKSATFKELEEILERIADEFDGDLRSYSGRCMYGAYCAGITCESDQAPKVIAKASLCGITGAKTDSMGLKEIVYWPRVKWEEPEEADE